MCDAIFNEFLKFAEGGGHLLIKKQRYVPFNKDRDTMRYILICKKQYFLIYVDIYIIYLGVLIPNYKRTYDQSDQIEK